MPQPLPSDLHVNVPLTNVAVAWKANESGDYISDKVFPNVPVSKQGDKYWKFHRPDWRRTKSQKRAPSTESVGIGWRASTDTYFAEVYAVHKDIDDRLRANADSIFRLDKVSTEQVMNDLHLRRDKDWVTNFFAASIWGRDITGTTDFTKWDAANSTPIEDIRSEKRTQKRKTGFDPNTLVLTPDVEDTLLDHSTILDRIKYTERGVISLDLIASLFKVDNVYTINAVEDSNDEEYEDLATDDSNAVYSFLASEKALLTYSAKSPTIDRPSGGYTFSWNGYVGGTSNGIRVKKFRQEAINSDRIEGEMAYDMKVTAADCGTMLLDVIT